MDEPLIISEKRDSRLQDARRCPFCNSVFLVFQAGPESKIWHRTTWRVSCVACSTRGPLAGSPKQAVVRWNGIPLFGKAMTLRDQTAAQSTQTPEPPPTGQPDRRRLPRQRGT